ncbi:hypothetical protein JCM8097_001474 [Rhodosporidiobolus ruineniae]
MIRSIRPYGVQSQRRESNKENGTSAGRGKAVEASRGGVDGDNERRRTSDSTIAASLDGHHGVPNRRRTKSFDPRSPDFDSTSFPRPGQPDSSASQAARAVLSATDKGKGKAVDAEQLDSDTLLPLLTATLDENDSLRAQLAAATSLPPLSSSSSTGTAPTASTSKTPSPTLPSRPDPSASLARAGWAASRAVSATLKPAAGEAALLRAQLATTEKERDLARKERDVARGRLFTAEGHLAAAARGAAAGTLPAIKPAFASPVAPSGRTARSAPAPPAPAFLHALTAERDGLALELAAKEVAIAKLKDVQVAAEVRRLKEKKERERERSEAEDRWEDERERRRAERRVRELEDDVAEREERGVRGNAVANGSEVVDTAGGPSTSSPTVTSQHQLPSHTPAATSLTAALVTLRAEHASTQQDLSECLKLLDDLVLEHSHTQAEKTAVEERARGLERALATLTEEREREREEKVKKRGRRMSA